MAKNLVLGAGPIGLIAAAYLSKAGEEVIIHDPFQQERMAQIKERGLTVINDGWEKNSIDNITTHIGVLEDLKDLSGEEIGRVFVATKAFSLEGVIKDIKNSLCRQKFSATGFVSLQNGYGVEKVLSEGLDVNAARVAVNYVGHITEDGDIEGHWLRRPNFIGDTYPQHRGWAREVARLLTRSGLDIAYVRDIRLPTWRKNVLNSTLCPICTITGKTMGEAMADPHLEGVCRKVMTEGWDVAKTMGLEYTDEDTNLDKACAYLRAGGDHVPTMVTDMRNIGRTENQYMNRAIVKEATRNGIDVPVNFFLYSAIFEIEQSQRKEETLKKMRDQLYNLPL